jgi:hypothetical protein
MQFYIAIGIAGIGRVVIRPKISIMGLKRTFYHPFILSYLSFHVIFNGDPSPISPQVASLYQRWLGKRTRQLGPRTTRTETSRPVSEDKSARKRGLVGLYVKTTRTV